MFRIGRKPTLIVSPLLGSDHLSHCRKERKEFKTDDNHGSILCIKRSTVAGVLGLGSGCWDMHFILSIYTQSSSSFPGGGQSNLGENYFPLCLLGVLTGEPISIVGISEANIKRLHGGGILFAERQIQQVS